jgi:hypothetical protein
MGECWKFFCCFCYGEASFLTKSWRRIKYAYVPTTYILRATLGTRAIFLLPCLSISLKDKGNLWKTPDSSWSGQRLRYLLNRKQQSITALWQTTRTGKRCTSFFALTKESQRVYILLTLSGVRKWKKTSWISVLFREASRNSSYSEDAFVVSNATRKADSFFTNGSSTDTTASDLLDYELVVQCVNFMNLNPRHVNCGNGVQ